MFSSPPSQQPHPATQVCMGRGARVRSVASRSAPARPLGLAGWLAGCRGRSSVQGRCSTRVVARPWFSEGRDCFAAADAFTAALCTEGSSSAPVSYFRVTLATQYHIVQRNSIQRLGVPQCDGVMFPRHIFAAQLCNDIWYNVIYYSSTPYTFLLSRNALVSCFRVIFSLFGFVIS